MKHNLYLLLVVTPVLTCSCCPGVVPEPAPVEDIELVGHIGGVANAVAVQGDYAYAGIGSELAILDISDPLAIQQVGAVVLPGIVDDVDVWGAYAYVAIFPDRRVTDAQLLVVDVSNPQDPFEVPEMTLEGKNITIVPEAPDGRTYAFVGLWNEVWVLDVTDQDAPERLGSYSLSSTPAVEIAIVDGYAYVLWEYSHRSSRQGGVKVLDVTDPTALHEVGAFEGDSFPIFYGNDAAFAVEGECLYLGTYRNGVHVVNVSDPAGPAHVGDAGHTGARTVDIEVADDLAYVAYDDGVLEILDVSDAMHPVTLSARQVLPDECTDIDVSGGYVFIATGCAGGLRVVDVSDPTAPISAGGYDASGLAEHLALADGRAYLLSREGDLWIADVSNPRLTSPAGRYTLWAGERFIKNMLLVDGYLFYVTAEMGLQVASVLDPTNAETVDLGGVVNTLAQARDPTGRRLLYVAMIDDPRSDGGVEVLRVLDSSDPLQPQEIGQVKVGDPDWWWPHVRDVFVADDGHAYAASVRGLWVLDVSDASHLRVVARHETPGAAQAVAVAEGHAYVADGLSGLCTFDVSDPANPIQGHVGIAHLTIDVAVEEEIVYALNEGEGLWAWDATDPVALSNPRNYYLPGTPKALAVDGELVYALDAEGGLYILRVNK
jgi:hypothetical protein